MACIIEEEGKLSDMGICSHLLSTFIVSKNRIPQINDVWGYEENRNKGIATALIAHLEQLAKQEGYHIIGIGVGLYRDYGTAQRLYFRLGYKPDGEGLTYKHAGSYLERSPQ